MIQPPSQHPLIIIDDPMKDFYELEFHSDVEQSAIYSNIEFHCIREQGFGIVLTSQCDIQFSHPLKYMLLARIAPVSEIYFLWLMEKKKIPDNEIEKAREEKNYEMILKHKTDFINNHLNCDRTDLS